MCHLSHKALKRAIDKFTSLSVRHRKCHRKNSISQRYTTETTALQKAIATATQATSTAAQTDPTPNAQADKKQARALMPQTHPQQCKQHPHKMRKPKKKQARALMPRLP